MRPSVQLQPTAPHLSSNAQNGFDYQDLLAKANDLRRTAPKEALQYIESIKIEFEKIDDPVLLYKRLIIQMDAAHHLGRHSQAQAAAEELWKLEKRIHAPLHKGFLFNTLSAYYVHSAHPDLSRAYECIIRAYECARIADNDYLRAVVCVQRGNVHCAAIELAGAFEWQTKAIAYAQRHLDRMGTEGDEQSWKCAATISIAFMNIASIYRQIGDSRTAYQYFRKALYTATRAGRKVLMVQALGSVGFVLTQRMNFRKALPYYQQGIALAEEIGITPELISLLSGMATCYADNNQMESAMRSIRKALLLSKNCPDLKSRGKTLFAYGQLLLREGRFQEAERIFRRVAAIRIRLNLRESMVEVYHGLMNAYAATGAMEKFMHCEKKLRQLRAKLQGPQQQRNIIKAEQQKALLTMQKRDAEVRHKLEETELKAAQLGREADEVRVKLLRYQQSLQKLHDYLVDQTVAADSRLQALANDILRTLGTDATHPDNIHTVEFEFERSGLDLARRLLAVNPDITPTELRVCTLSRLGMSLKKIGELMYLSLDTVKTHRKHIRRKLGLQTSENLTAFLIELSTAPPS